MIDTVTMLDLLRTHLLWEDETVGDVTEWPDGWRVRTSAREYTIGPETEWRIVAEPWVEELLMAVREDIRIIGGGARSTDGLLRLTDGSTVYLNDAAAVAELGRRLLDGMDPVAYAEILVEFHPWTAARRAPLVDPQDLRRRYDRQDLPLVAVPALVLTSGGAELVFSSYRQYALGLGGELLLDIVEWRVVVPADGPATWTNRTTIEGLPALAPLPRA